MAKRRASPSRPAPGDAITWVFDLGERTIFRNGTREPDIWAKQENFIPTIAVEDGERVYLVVVKHTTGDTFKRDPEPRITVVDAYPDEEAAIAMAKAIRAHHDAVNAYGNDKAFTFEEKHGLAVTYGNGETRTWAYAPWLGHFEEVVSIEVVPVIAGLPTVSRF